MLFDFLSVNTWAQDTTILDGHRLLNPMRLPMGMCTCVLLPLAVPPTIPPVSHFNLPHASILPLDLFLVLLTMHISLFLPPSALCS